MNVRERARQFGLVRSLRVAPRFLRDWAVSKWLGYNPATLRPGMVALPTRDAHMRKVVASLDAAISPSRFLITRFVEWGVPASLFHHVPNSIASHLSTRRRPTGPPIAGRPTFGFLGRLSPYKGAHVLVDAFRRLDPGAATLSIWGEAAVGKEAYAREVREQASGAPHIMFKGGFHADQLGEVLDQIDVLVVPSVWYENNPLVILEAFAAGIPVVAGNVGGMAELVRHEVNGLQFCTGDPADLATKLQRLISQPDLIKRFRTGISTPWSPNEQGAAVERIYRQLL